MNPNYNGNQVYSNSHMLKGFFSRTSVLTVTVASAILTALIIFQTIICGYSGDKINMLSSLYYMVGDDYVSIVNIVFGSLISFVSILFFASFLTTYLKAKSNDEDLPETGLSLMLFSSVTYIVISCIGIIISFASISVMRYQSSRKFDRREFSSVPNTQMYTEGSAYYDFFCSILFGVCMILLGIGAVRLVLAMKKACQGELPRSTGSSLLTIGTVSLAILTSIDFIVELYNLVVPNVSDNYVLEPIELLFSIINILILAAVSTLLYALSFVISNYASSVNRIFHPNRATSYYASYATNVYPTNAVRPIPPTAPTQPPVQNSQPYNAYNQGTSAYTPPMPPMPQENQSQPVPQQPVNGEPEAVNSKD